MMRRMLGRSGIEVSALGLGCYPMGGPFWRGDHDKVAWQSKELKQFPGGWGAVDDQESIRAIHTALDLGINFLDTSESYGCGHSERVIGKAIAGRRNQVVLGTKFGNVIDEDRKLYLGHRADPDFIRQCCVNSLQRLSTDYIDIYYLHWGDFDGDLDPILATLEDLSSEGKIRAYGWSTDNAEAMREFAAGSHCSAVEFALNLIRQNPEMLQLCDDVDLGGVIRSPLSMGLLTGKYSQEKQFDKDDIRHNWNLAEGRFAEIHGLVEALRDILTSEGRSVVQGALAWIWAQSDRIVPIPGFRNVSQIEENARAMEFGSLTQSSVDEIEQIMSSRADQ